VNSTLTANHAGAGGAGGAGGTGPLHDFQGPGGDGGSGGGLFLSGLGTAAAALTHVTINGNVTGASGAPGAQGTSPDHQAPGSAAAGGTGGGLLIRTVFFQNQMTLTNSVVASNSTPNCATAVFGAVNDGGHNVAFPASDTSCPAAVRADPLLAALADYGGATKTERIGQSSPARDMVPATGASCEGADQRQVTRPLGPACDAGAYELGVPLIGPGGPPSTTPTTATVKSTINPNTFTTTYRFEYGKTKSYGSKTPVAPVLSGAPMAQLVSAKLTKLQPNTLYHYRLVATNGEGVVAGPDRNFKTKPLPFRGVGLPTAQAKLDSKGRVKIKVVCPKASIGSCRGKLTLKAKLAGKTKAIGSSGFKNVAAGKTKTLTIKLSDVARLAIAANGKLKATEIAKSQDSRLGPRQTTSRNATLKPA
jgi:hypothetical protein